MDLRNRSRELSFERSSSPAAGRPALRKGWLRPWIASACLISTRCARAFGTCTIVLAPSDLPGSGAACLRALRGLCACVRAVPLWVRSTPSRLRALCLRAPAGAQQCTF